MRLDEKYLLVQMFYPIVPNDRGDDVLGDLAISRMLGPLIARLRGERAADRYEFMRYSDGGYHLRMKFHAEDCAVLEEARDRLVLPAIEEFRVDQGDLLAVPMRLGDFAEKLAGSLGDGAAPLRRGGEVHATFAKDVGGLHEDDDVRYEYLKFSERMCDLAVDVVTQGSDISVRKVLVRLMLMDLFDATGLDAAGLHYVLCFVRRQWERYFSIKPDQVEACIQNAAAVAHRFHRFLDGKRGIEGSAEALPRELRGAYVRRVAELAESMPALVRRDESEVINNNTALRLMSAIHLAHNRLGMNIYHELTFAEIASAFHARHVDPSTVANNVMWVGRNLGRYFEENHSVTY